MRTVDYGAVEGYEYAPELVRKIREEGMQKRADEQEAAKTELARLVSGAHPQKLAIREIQKIAAKAHGFTIADIFAQTRIQAIVECRHDAMAAAYVNRPEFSLVQIGRHFRRDHTTVLHACQKRGAWRGHEARLTA